MGLLDDILAALSGNQQTDIVLGRALSPWNSSEFRITAAMQRQHALVLGKTGTGKSVALQQMFLQRHYQRQGRGGVMLIDPHGDAARACIAREVADHRFHDPSAYDDLRYVRWDPDAVPAMNLLLAEHVLPEDVSHGVRDAFARAFPEMDGAPLFETLCAPSALCLQQSGLPLPLMGQLLLNPELRRACLARTDNYAAHEALSMLPDTTQGVLSMAGSLLRRLEQLNFHPVLLHSLIQPDTVLPMRTCMDEGVNVVVDLGSIHSASVKRFIAASILTSLERAAFTRETLPPAARRHYMVICDEFPSIAPKSGDVVASITSELRKFGITWIMAGQSIAQFSATTLAASIENTGLTILFSLGYDSATALARMIANPDPKLVKHEATTPGGRDTYFSHSEQVTALVEDLRHIPPRHCIATIQGQSPCLVRVPDIPEPKPDPAELKEVFDEYRRRYSTSYRHARERGAAAVAATGLPVPPDALMPRLLALGAPDDEDDPLICEPFEQA